MCICIYIYISLSLSPSLHRHLDICMNIKYYWNHQPNRNNGPWRKIPWVGNSQIHWSFSPANRTWDQLIARQLCKRVVDKIIIIANRCKWVQFSGFIHALLGPMMLDHTAPLSLSGRFRIRVKPRANAKRLTWRDLKSRGTSNQLPHKTKSKIATENCKNWQCQFNKCLWIVISKDSTLC